MQNEPCNHAWRPIDTPHRSCLRCGECRTATWVDTLAALMLLSSVAAILAFLLGCAGSPSDGGNAPPSSPAQPGTYSDGESTVRRGDARLGVSTPTVPTQTQPSGHAGQTPLANDERSSVLPPHPVPSPWRESALAQMEAGVAALEDAGLAVPAQLDLVWAWLDVVLMPEVEGVAHAWELMRMGIAEIGDAPQELREPFRRVLIGLGKLRAVQEP